MWRVFKRLRGFVLGENVPARYAEDVVQLSLIEAWNARHTWGPTTTDLDKLLFLRRFLALVAVPLLLSLVLGLARGAPTLLWGVLGVGWACWLVSAVKLPFDLRRERQERRG